MHWLALREAWWPMAVAVAWVLLRSRPVVEQLLDRHPRKPITFTTVATYTAALKAGGQHTTPEFENSEAAFRELRHPLETGEIEIVGTPFVRVSDREGSSRLEMGNQQTIFYSEISSLVPYNDLGDLCLIPRDWRVAHGSARTNLRGYRNVLVRSAALVRAFPEERTQLAHVPSDSVVPPLSLENITVDTLKQSAPNADPSHQTVNTVTEATAKASDAASEGCHRSEHSALARWQHASNRKTSRRSTSARSKEHRRISVSAAQSAALSVFTVGKSARCGQVDQR